MHKMIIMIAAAALAVPAAAQQTDPANATGDVQMNGLATDPATAPGATDPAMAPGTTATDPAMAPATTAGDPYGTAAPARQDRGFPWGLLGLAGLAGLLGRKRNDRDDTVRRDRAA